MITESDPNGIPANVPGAKLDKDKNRMGLMTYGFAKALWAVGEVSTYGANKYSDNGWMEVENGVDRYDDALVRHLNKWNQGEFFDDESQLPHLAHAAWNLLAVLELITRAREENKEWLYGEIMKEDILQLTPRQMESTSEKNPDLSLYPPAQKKDSQDAGEEKLIHLPEKSLGRIKIDRNSESTPKDSFQYSTTVNSISGHSEVAISR